MLTSTITSLQTQTIEPNFETYYRIAQQQAYRYRRFAFDKREDLEQSAALAALEALQTETTEQFYSTINRVLYRETVNRGWKCCGGKWQCPEGCYENWTEIAFSDGASDFEPCELEQLSFEIFANVYQKLANYYGNWQKSVAAKAKHLTKRAERTHDYEDWLTFYQAANICRLYTEFGPQGVAEAWSGYQQKQTTKKDTNSMLLDYSSFRAFYRDVATKSRYDRLEARDIAKSLLTQAIAQQQKTGKTETGTVLAMTMFRLYYKHGSNVEAAWAELAEMGFAVGDELHPVNPKSADSGKAKVKETVAA